MNRRRKFRTFAEAIVNELATGKISEERMRRRNTCSEAGNSFPGVLTMGSWEQLEKNQPDRVESKTFFGLQLKG